MCNDSLGIGKKPAHSRLYAVQLHNYPCRCLHAVAYCAHYTTPRHRRTGRVAAHTNSKKETYQIKFEPSISG